MLDYYRHSYQRAIDVPLTDANTCQAMLRTTRLGANFVLDKESFICAGGEYAKDAVSWIVSGFETMFYVFCFISCFSSVLAMEVSV